MYNFTYIQILIHFREKVNYLWKNFGILCNESFYFRKHVTTGTNIIKPQAKEVYQYRKFQTVPDGYDTKVGELGDEVHGM